MAPSREELEAGAEALGQIIWQVLRTLDPQPEPESVVGAVVGIGLLIAANAPDPDRAFETMLTMMHETWPMVRSIGGLSS